MHLDLMPCSWQIPLNWIRVSWFCFLIRRKSWFEFVWWIDYLSLSLSLNERQKLWEEEESVGRIWELHKIELNKRKRYIFSLFLKQKLCCSIWNHVDSELKFVSLLLVFFYVYVQELSCAAVFHAQWLKKVEVVSDLLSFSQGHVLYYIIYWCLIIGRNIQWLVVFVNKKHFLYFTEIFLIYYFQELIFIFKNLGSVAFCFFICICTLN